MKKALALLLTTHLLAASISSAENANNSKRNQIIPTSEYSVSTTVRKLGQDYIGISGRIGNGPTCENMQVTALARNESGMKARVVVFTKLSNSSGSTLFEGKKQVKGSNADNSSWSVGKIVIRCFD